MAAQRKITQKYYFSVEGKTEQWYLQWLEKTINGEPKAKFRVKLDCTVEKDPMGTAKRLSNIDKITVTHVFDRESESEEHRKNFADTLQKMKKAEQSGKKILYRLGYTNYTFDLWMILHKDCCRRSFADRSQYLGPLNRAYGTEFASMSQYKEEENFKKLLEGLTLDHVRTAIRNGEKIMEGLEKDGVRPQKFGKYTFYTENPALNLHEVIREILKTCKLL